MNEIHGISKLGIDTSPLIYFIENNPNYLDKVLPFFVSASKSELTLITSTITLLEVLVVPYRVDRQDLVREYRNILENSENIFLIPLNTDISILSAKLRSKYNLKTPDSIQIGTAIHSECNAFLTNDRKLKIVSEINVILLDDL